MPHVVVKMYPGRSEDQKRRLANAIARDLAEIAESRQESVSVAIEEVAPQDWAEQVYRPEILEKPESIYRSPGYNPFDGQ